MQKFWCKTNLLLSYINFGQNVTSQLDDNHNAYIAQWTWSVTFTVCWDWNVYTLKMENYRNYIQSRRINRYKVNRYDFLNRYTFW